MTRRVSVLRWTSVGLAVAVAGALLAYSRPGPVRNWVKALVGPPARQLAEAYAEETGGPSVDHSLWAALLEAHVDADGWVDYAALGDDVERLDRYLEAVAAAPFAELGRNEKLALLLNAYNAFTVKLILERYPLDSIKDIPAARRWDDRRWRVGSRLLSLNELEHEEIRPKFREPRIHFALGCAAAGCPPLARQAFAADRLDEQLDEQTRYVHEHATWLRFDPQADTVYLTELYSWYGGDFEQVAGSVVEYAARYSPELRRALDAGREPADRWLPYDWSLNDVANRQPR